MSRYRARPWTLTHGPSTHNGTAWDEHGVMLFTKKHSLFVGSEHVYDVANLLVDAHEEGEHEA